MLALDLARTEAHAKEKERKNLGSPPSPANNGSNEEVLEHFSKGLRDALSEDNHAKTLQLCKLAKNLPKASYDVFYDLILEFFSVGNQHVQLAVHAIEDELTAQKTGIILREESVASELLTRIFFREDGLAYLQRAVLPTIKRIYTNRNSMKTDLAPEDPGIDPEANLHIIFFYCRTMVNQLIATVGYFPSQLVSILRVLQASAEKTPVHADSAKTVVSSLLFLRYICPTIVHPRLAGVQEDLSPAAMLALVNMAKLLQCAANHTHWNPEKPFAAIIDKFIDTELQPLIDSLSQEILFKSRSYYAVVPQNSKPGVTSRALSKLVVYLGTNTDLYESVEEVRSIMAGYILWLEAAADGPLDSPPSPTLAHVQPQPPDFPSPRRVPSQAVTASPRPQAEDPRLIPLTRPVVPPMSAKAKLLGISRASSVAITAAEKKQGPQIIQNKFFDALGPPQRRGSLDGFVPPPPSASTLLLDALPAAPVLQNSARVPPANQSTLRMSEASIALATKHLASMMGANNANPSARTPSPTSGAALSLSGSSSLPSLHNVGNITLARSPLEGSTSSATSTSATSDTSSALLTPINSSNSTTPISLSAHSQSQPVLQATASMTSSNSPKRERKEKEKEKDKKEKRRDSRDGRRDSKDGERRRERSNSRGRDSRDGIVQDKKEKKEKKDKKKREELTKKDLDIGPKPPATATKDRSSSREGFERPPSRGRRHSFDALSGMTVSHGQVQDLPPTPAKRISGDVAKEARIARQMVKEKERDRKGEEMVVTINPLRKDLMRGSDSDTTSSESPRRPNSGLLAKLFPSRKAPEEDSPKEKDAPLSARLTQMPKVPSGERAKLRKAQFADADAVQHSTSAPMIPDSPPGVATKRRSLSQPMAPPMLPLKKTSSNPQVSQVSEELRSLLSRVNKQIVREVGIVGPPLTVHQPLPHVFVTSWICAREVVHFATLPRCLLSLLFLDGAAALGALALRPESELVQMSLQDEEFSHRALVRVFSAAPQAGESISEEASKQLIRRFHWWCLSASHSKGHNESPGRPFNPDLVPEIIALFVYVHYINRVMLAVFGRKTWVQDWLGTLVRPAMRSSRRGDARRAGESLLLVPGRQAPPSVQVWASHSPILGRVYAVFAGALRDAVLAYVPEALLTAFSARVQRWNGAPITPSAADVDADCGGEGAAVRAAYALMLRTAFEPAQISAERRAFREHYSSSAALLAVSAHAAMEAALHLGALAA